MRRVMIGLAGAVTIWSLLGCSGFMEGMEEGMREAALEQLTDAEEGVRELPKGKERVQLGKMVDEVKKMAAEADGSQVILVTTFAVATNEAISDGELTKEELTALKDLVEKMREEM